MTSVWCRQTLSGFLLCFSFLLTVVSKTQGQQCLDFMPPFIPTSPLLFCQTNSEYGCCTSDDDVKLATTFNLIRRSIAQINDIRDNNARNNDTQSNECLNYVKSFLCAKCSPFSAEIFQRSIARFGEALIPGLCDDFCDRFYAKCANFVYHYLSSLSVTGTTLESIYKISSLTRSTSSIGFCEAVSLPIDNAQYCHPSISASIAETRQFTSDKVNTADCVCLESYNISLTNPVVVTSGNDGTDRMFVAEQQGVVKVINPDGTALPDNFLDIRDKVYHDEEGFSQLGLLGLALHPQFKENQKLYLFYTLKNTTSLYIRVEEYRSSYKDKNVADLSTNRIILEFKKESNNNAGGPLLFGDDGFLFIFIGDDGGKGDAMETSQDLFLLSGKVLRIDVDTTDFVRGKEYSIPSDNPFVGKEDMGLPEIYAWGLRHPRGCNIEKMSSHSGKTGGRIFCADVGMDTFEEVNIIKKNANYGWNLRQGTTDLCPDCLRGSPNISLTDPIFEYRHTLGMSVVGGHVYRGCLNPNLIDQYIFGDFQKGILRLTEKNDIWTGDRLELCSPKKCRTPLTDQIQSYIHGFGEDEQGELYVLTTSSPNLRTPTGRISKLVDPARRGNPLQCRSARPDDGKSAVTGTHFRDMKSHTDQGAVQDTSQIEPLRPPELQRIISAAPRRIQQRQPNNRRGRSGLFGGFFERRGQQNDRHWNEQPRFAENRRQMPPNQLHRQTVLNRPIVRESVDKIKNSRTIASVIGSARNPRPIAFNNTDSASNIPAVSDAVIDILRAAGLDPSQTQATVVRLDPVQPRNTNVKTEVPRLRVADLGPGTTLSKNRAVGIRNKLPHTNIAGKRNETQPIPGLELRTFLSQNTAAANRDITRVNTVTSLDTVFPPHIAAVVEGILGQNKATGQKTITSQKKLSAPITNPSQTTISGPATLPQNALNQLGEDLLWKTSRGPGTTVRQNTTSRPRAALPRNTASGLGVILPQNTPSRTGTIKKQNAFGGGRAVTVDNESGATIIRLGKRK